MRRGEISLLIQSQISVAFLPRMPGQTHQIQVEGHKIFLGHTRQGNTEKL